jgi:hypothetical protein
MLLPQFKAIGRVWLLMLLLRFEVIAKPAPTHASIPAHTSMWLFN